MDISSAGSYDDDQDYASDFEDSAGSPRNSPSSHPKTAATFAVTDGSRLGDTSPIAHRNVDSIHSPDYLASDSWENDEEDEDDEYNFDPSNTVLPIVEHLPPVAPPPQPTSIETNREHHKDLEPDDKSDLAQSISSLEVRSHSPLVLPNISKARSKTKHRAHHKHHHHSKHSKLHIKTEPNENNDEVAKIMSPRVQDASEFFRKLSPLSNPTYEPQQDSFGEVRATTPNSVKGNKINRSEEDVTTTQTQPETIQQGNGQNGSDSLPPGSPNKWRKTFLSPPPALHTNDQNNPKIDNAHLFQKYPSGKKTSRVRSRSGFSRITKIPKPKRLEKEQESLGHLPPWLLENLQQDSHNSLTWLEKCGAVGAHCPLIVPNALEEGTAVVSTKETSALAFALQIVQQDKIQSLALQQQRCSVENSAKLRNVRVVEDDLPAKQGDLNDFVSTQHHPKIDKPSLTITAHKVSIPEFHDSEARPSKALLLNTCETGNFESTFMELMHHIDKFPAELGPEEEDAIQCRRGMTTVLREMMLDPEILSLIKLRYANILP